MATITKTGAVPALGSDWGGLSPHLLATFFAVTKRYSDDKKSIRWERDLDQPEVFAPISDANVEAVLNWHSPFENVGFDSALSSFAALAQSGGFSSLFTQLESLLPKTELLTTFEKQVKTLEGKSNLTKLNSTQVFQGMPPLKITLTAHFRAYMDAKAEVEDPLEQLMKWALPKKIAPDGPILGLAAGSLNVFASEVPQILGLRYRNRILAPIVIESVPYPMSGPIDADGRLTHAAVALTLGSLTALDKQDWIASTSAQTFRDHKF